MLILTLTRDPAVDNSLFGRLYIDGVFECFTVENNTLRLKEGTYPVVLTESPRLKYICPELLNTEPRSGIRIHIANYARELEGCIAPGKEKTPEMVCHSGAAFRELFEKLLIAQSKDEPVQITII